MKKLYTNTINRIFTIIGLLLLLFVIITIWYIPRASSDLLIAMAAGRDIMSGHPVNGPDTWSFSTDSKEWLNQNWGAGIILYLANNLFGGTGLLIVKMLLLMLCALFIILQLKQLKIPLSISIIVTAIVMISLNVYTTLRPNLFTIVFLTLELWLLYKTDKQPFFIWPIVLLLFFWANTHGGFIYGLGLFFLWVCRIIIPELIQYKAAALKNKWQFLGGAAAALLLTGLVNPFGLMNLAFPFTMIKGGVWNIMRDWQPIWANGLSSYTTGIVNFLVILGLSALLLSIQITYIITTFRTSRKTAGDQKIAKILSKNTVNTIITELKKQNNLPQISIIFFEIIMAVISISMAVLSNRFIVVALIMMAPILARQMQWFVSTIRFAWIAPLTIICLLAIYSSLIMNDNIRNYQPNNPFINTGTGTLEEKMHFVNEVYDTPLAHFINTNQISGNVIGPWQWEGFLRWNCPQLKVFVGGRAQQVYSEETFSKYLYIMGMNVAQFHGKAPEDLLQTIDAHLIISGNSDDYADLILTALNCGNWVIVYADKKGLIFANTKWPATARIARQLTEDNLTYPDPATKAMSKAAFILSQPALWKEQHLIDLFTEALNYEPNWLWSYKMLFKYTQTDPVIFNQLITLANNRLNYLEEMNLNGPDAASLLQCRIFLSATLYNITKNKDKETALITNAYYIQSTHLYDQLKVKWRQLLIH